MSKLYVAIERFKDLQDDGFEYKAGMIYPREGIEVSETRINELATSKNLMGKVLIAELVGLNDGRSEDIKTTEVEDVESDVADKGTEVEDIKTTEVEDVESDVADKGTEVEDIKKTRKSRSKKTE